MWSRNLTTKMGIDQNDFVKAFVLALSDEGVMKKLEESISGKLSREIADLRNVICEKDKKIDALKEEVDKLTKTVEQHEQYSRRMNLRFSGIAEDSNEDVADVVLAVINEKMTVTPPITVHDLDRVHRLGRRAENGAPRPVLVRFSTYRVRRRVFGNRVLLNPRRRRGAPGMPWADVDGEVRPPGASDVEKQAIFVNEDLTRSRAHLLWQARMAKRDNKIKDCWSADGNILIKDNYGRIKQVNNTIELNG